MLTSHLQYDGKLSRVYGLWLKNTILNCVTLFIYRSWAKTVMRRYLYSRCTIFGDRLEYTGTGWEIFKGFLYAALFIMIVSFAQGFLSMLGLLVVLKGDKATAQEFNDAIATCISILIVLCLYYYAGFSALHYRLTRTLWRGITGRLNGKPRHYMFFRLKRMLINICTLGYAIGRSDLVSREYIVKRMFIGSQSFSFQYHKNALDGTNLITLLLALPTLGFSRFWYKAALHRVCWNNMKAGSISFKSTYTGLGILGLYAGNLCILLITLGIGTPIVIQRTIKFFMRNVAVLGSLEGTTILQDTTLAKTVGEGIISALNYDGFDIDLGLF